MLVKMGNHEEVKMISKPFSVEILDEIFRVSPKNTQRALSRESTTLEFKETFGWLSLPEYLKTAAAFANSRGGYIVFGVTRMPHKLGGLSENGLRMFSSLEPAKLTEHLNDYFCPEIKWTMYIHEIAEKSFGLLYFYEAEEKPVVCSKTGELMKESDIYYRYRGRSQRIKYNELREILDTTRKREQQLWMEQILRIAKIGVNNIGIFDLNTGLVAGKKGSFLIDEALLKKLSFIKEGEFSEREGKPTLKLVGAVEPVNTLTIVGKKQIIKEKTVITISDIILSFLKQEKVSDPENYIKQICLGTTAYLPVYYYIKQASIGIDKAIDVIGSIVVRSQAKEILKKRLTNRTSQRLEIAEHHSVGSDKKKKYKRHIIEKTINLETLEGQELIYCVQAVRGFSPEEIKVSNKIIFDFLEMSFVKHYGDPIFGVGDNIRRAICWVDEALYMK